MPLICLGVFSAFGQAIAEALNIPIINVEPTPLLWTRAFPAPSWPIQRDLGGWHNYLSGKAMLQVIWQWYRPFIHAFRQRLGLPAYSAARFYRTLRSTPMLSAYSPSIIPHPADWPENVHITGYFFPDTPSDWQPSPELEAFLDAGDPPVYIGFGSMAGRNPEQFAQLILEALARSGQRGLLLTGWGGLRPEIGARQCVRGGFCASQLVVPAHGGGRASWRGGDNRRRAAGWRAVGDRPFYSGSALLGRAGQSAGPGARANSAQEPYRRPLSQRDQLWQ